METKEQKIERLSREIGYFKRIIDDCINKYMVSKDSFLKRTKATGGKGRKF